MKKKKCQFIIIILSTLIAFQPAACFATDTEFYSSNDILFLDQSDGCNTSSSSFANSSGQTTYSLEQVKAFAAEPISSAWGISDDAAEQWFLKQSGAQATISKYGLNSSNINQITSTVKDAGVSPALFYAYTVNEGGGAGGFINHYGSDTDGGSVGNAQRDAKYLVDQSQSTGGSPATGGGEPDMPTAEAQAILDALPSGSIGVVYIQATAAVTAELEDLSGKTGGWSGLFGKPLTGVMSSITEMGGDPMNGAVESECAGGVAGEGMTKGINWAKMIANNNGYGYDQTDRTTGWEKYQSDPNCTSSCGSFDCSSFISAILTAAGYFDNNPNFSTSNEAEELTQAGFKQVATSATSSADLQPGDILIKDNEHTEMYIGDNQNVGARSEDEKGEVGDQTDEEISVKPFYDDGWDQVWRATK